VNRTGRIFRRMLFFVVAMIAIRHFIPEMETQLPGVYKLLDEVAIPVINWLYAMACKVYITFANLPVVENVLDILANLVA